MYYNYFLPNNYHNNTNYLTNEFILAVLKTMGLDEGYLVQDYMEEFYFGNKLGDLETMTPGIVDVSIYVVISLTFNYETTFI